MCFDGDLLLFCGDFLLFLVFFCLDMVLLFFDGLDLVEVLVEDFFCVFVGLCDDVSLGWVLNDFGFVIGVL